MDELNKFRPKVKDYLKELGEPNISDRFLGDRRFVVKFITGGYVKWFRDKDNAVAVDGLEQASVLTRTELEELRNLNPSFYDNECESIDANEIVSFNFGKLRERIMSTMSLMEAEKLMDTFLEAYPELKNYIREHHT